MTAPEHTTLDPEERFRRFLVRSGHRVTPQRLQVARAFFASGGHVSVDELFQRLRRHAPRMGHATVYRTLHLLAQAGLASRREFEQGYARYEHEPAAAHHDHLICTRCGRIVEFEEERIEALQAAVARRHGFDVTHHRLELYGLCASCRRTP